MIRADKSSRKHTDHLNTPRLVADSAGASVWRWDQQEPFGVNGPDENPSGLGAFEMPLRFPGQYADKETGLHYNYFRDYDPSHGIYKQFDPIGLRGGLNGYAYVGADPLALSDPFGLRAGGLWNTFREFLTRQVGGGAGAGVEISDVPSGYQSGMQAGITIGRELCRTGTRDYVTDCIDKCVKQFPRESRPSLGGAPEVNDCTGSCQSEYIKCRRPPSSACPDPARS